MTINERINKKLKPWGLTVEDLTEEELAEAKECLKPGTIDGFFGSPAKPCVYPYIIDSL